MSNGPWGISIKKLGGQMSGCPTIKLVPNTFWDRGEEDQGGKDGREREVISFDIYIDIVMCLNSNSSMFFIREVEGLTDY